MTSDREQVIRALKRALRDNPRRVRTLVALGSELRNLGADGEAEAYCRKALAICPYEPEALRTYGGILQLQGRYDEAVAIADAALAARPNCGAAWLVRGDSLYNSGRLDEAAEAYESAAGDPGAAFDAMVRLGKVGRALGRDEQALAALDRAAALKPDSALPLYERGLLRLELRDFQAGWADFEARWRVDRFIEASRGFVPAAMAPLLTTAPTAETLTGKRILLIGEQGIGDQLMFASMIPDLARVAASVVCLCEPRLMRLFAASFPEVVFLHPSGAQVDSDTVDVLLAMGSLGSAFRRTAEQFPGTAFVQPREEHRARWAARLGARAGRLRVGLSWRGGLPSTRRQARSIELQAMGPVLDLPDCEFVSLQYGDVQAEIDAVNVGRANPIRSFPAQDLNDFEDLAALIANLDVVVSVQTAAVHLSGALGKPCLALIPDNPEWRYMRYGSTMPWYGSVRLFRQAAPGEWAPVLEAISGALKDVGAG
ncbi:MAG: hypothetical protein JWQ29_3121 [Phenylobacterium sp.]|nr:hypothetical protein [Phenylobacterium sp.]